jgi:CheY-like chemotaxis protein
MTQAIVATADGHLGELLTAELEGEGLPVNWVSNGYDAIEAVGTGGRILFTGVELPVFDGFEVARRLRADPDIPAAFPIILLTGPDIDPHALDQAGITGTLPKSHTAQDVRELLSRFLYQS